jgi:RsiW-degrading membrane proteinase PrsW (M82 family)
MPYSVLAHAPVGLLPVVIFLGVLVYMDSYKLLRLRVVLWVIALGGATAVASYFANGFLITHVGLGFLEYSRYVAPVVEETLKGLAMVYLFRSNRIGFLVDAAILGFAVGAGFAVVENFYYLYSAGSTSMGVWIVRGFGTAIMHGGVAALFGVMAQTLTERSMKINPVFYLPGLLLASLLHSVFNHFPGSPILASMGTLMVLPPIFYLIFQRSARAMHAWLEVDFDADAELLELINSQEFSNSRIGMFLNDLRTKFEGPVVVDMLCYLRIYTELAVRAKGVLMMRENGLDAPVGERTREKFQELRYLEKSIGKTGVLAMKPFLQMERKDLWQLNVLE